MQHPFASFIQEREQVRGGLENFRLLRDKSFYHLWSNDGKFWVIVKTELLEIILSRDARA